MTKKRNLQLIGLEVRSVYYVLIQPSVGETFFNLNLTQVLTFYSNIEVSYSYIWSFILKTQIRFVKWLWVWDIWSEVNVSLTAFSISKPLYKSLVSTTPSGYLSIDLSHLSPLVWGFCFLQQEQQTISLSNIPSHRGTSHSSKQIGQVNWLSLFLFSMLLCY